MYPILPRNARILFIIYVVSNSHDALRRFLYSNPSSFCAEKFLQLSTKLVFSPSVLYTASEGELCLNFVFTFVKQLVVLLFYKASECSVNPTQPVFAENLNSVLRQCLPCFSLLAHSLWTVIYWCISDKLALRHMLVPSLQH